MIVVAARPGSASASWRSGSPGRRRLEAGMTSVIFSLEMSHSEITMRLLSAEARVALHSMRTGQMSEDDWNRLARRMAGSPRAAVHRGLAENAGEEDPGHVPAPEAAP